MLGGALLAPVGCGGDEPAGEGTDGDLGTEEGSTGEIGDTGETDGERAEDRVVPLDVSATALEARCFELPDAPLQISVAPEGQLWLRIDEQTWRVLDPFGSEDVQLLAPTVTALQAWSSERAFVIDGGVPWDVRGQWPQPLPWPAQRTEPTALCGDPSTDANGFVVADGLLHRDHGAWWEWTGPSDAPWANVSWLATDAGACMGPEGELWLAETSGEVWRITADFATRVPELDGADRGALLSGVGVAAVLDDALRLGEVDGLQQIRFEAGPVTAVSTGGGALWVVAGGAVHRWLEGDFTRALHDDVPVMATRLYADATGGAWALDEQRACHLHPTPPTRVEGVFDLQRLTTETIEITARTSAGTRLTSARLDGEDLSIEADGPSRWRAEPVEVGQGWHVLEVFASGSRGATARTLRFEQRRVGELSWVEHIEPLFEEHCSGAACHGPDLGPGTRPDLSSYEAWLEREDGILDRVVTKGDMPPLGARKDSWGLDARLTVAEWFQTGAAWGGND